MGGVGGIGVEVERHALAIAVNTAGEIRPAQVLAVPDAALEVLMFTGRPHSTTLHL